MSVRSSSLTCTTDSEYVITEPVSGARLASTPPGADTKIATADGDAATTSCPDVCTPSRPSRTWPFTSWTKAPPLISSVARGYSPSVVLPYVPAATDEWNDMLAETR